MRKSLNIFLIIASLLSNSCNEEGIRKLTLIANFDYSIEDLCQSPELEVLFENSSENASSYLWDFGDGTTSTELNPKKVYGKQGTYTVSLTAYDETKSKLSTKNIYIRRNSDGTGPIAFFEIVREDPKKMTFIFINKSQNADSCYWAYFSPDEDVCGDYSHSFSGPGKYVIILYASNAQGTNCHREILDIQPG